MCSVQSERQPISVTGSVQSGWTSCVTSKVSDSLCVSQAPSKVYKRHVLSPKWTTAYRSHRLSSHLYGRHVFSLKWATAYKCYRLSSKWMNVVCSVKSERQPMIATCSVQIGWTPCVKFKVSNSLWVIGSAQSGKHPQDKHQVFSLKWGTPSAWTSLVQYKVSDTLQVTLTFRIVACYIELNIWRSPLLWTAKEKFISLSRDISDCF